MKIKLSEIKEEFAQDIIEIFGDSTSTFSEIAPIENSCLNSLVYINSEKFLSALLESPAGIAIVPQNLIKEIQSKSDKTYVVSQYPELLMAKISQKYFARTPFKLHRGQPIHESAIISKVATTIGAGSLVDPYAVIGENVSIGENCYIGPHVVIEDNVSIGDQCWIYAQCFIGRFTHIGKQCVFQQQCLVGTSEAQFPSLLEDNGQHSIIIHDRVELGAQNIIEKGHRKPTIIGEGTKTDNHVVFKSECTVGKNCLLTAGLLMLKNSHMGNYCMTGGNTTLLENTKVCDQVQLAGVSVVSSDVENPGFYGGHPLQPLKEYLKTLAIIPNLPKIQKELGALKSGSDSTK